MLLYYDTQAAVSFEVSCLASLSHSFTASTVGFWRQSQPWFTTAGTNTNPTSTLDFSPHGYGPQRHCMAIPPPCRTLPVLSVRPPHFDSSQRDWVSVDVRWHDFYLRLVATVGYEPCRLRSCSALSPTAKDLRFSSNATRFRNTPAALGRISSEAAWRQRASVWKDWLIVLTIRMRVMYHF